MNIDSKGGEEPAVGRAPVGPWETALAHCRPRPAVPGLAVLGLTLLLSFYGADGGAELSFSWAMAFGTAFSCLLAVAAGFCSFFPPAAWIVLAALGLQWGAASGVAEMNRYLLLAGMLVAAAMLGVQLWRALTGRFQPTLPMARDAG